MERPLVVQSDQAGVAHHIRIDDGDQLPPILATCRPGLMRCSLTQRLTFPFSALPASLAETVEHVFVIFGRYHGGRSRV